MDVVSPERSTQVLQAMARAIQRVSGPSSPSASEGRQTAGGAEAEAFETGTACNAAVTAGRSFLGRPKRADVTKTSAIGLLKSTQPADRVKPFL